MGCGSLACFYLATTVLASRLIDATTWGIPLGDLLLNKEVNQSHQKELQIVSLRPFSLAPGSNQPFGNRLYSVLGHGSLLETNVLKSFILKES